MLSYCWLLYLLAVKQIPAQSTPRQKPKDELDGLNNLGQLPDAQFYLNSHSSESRKSSYSDKEIHQLCEEYTSTGYRLQGQHCYIFVNTVLVCGRENERDAIYEMNTGSPKHESLITGRPYEVHCSGILALLDQSKASDEL
ncbi:hypothetical protein BGW36DRAFT_369954 [Talaromyces proteolyticus]|uniref:Uncharacterized protein n=1 Tax=Talaromyces proteolyticus TaxID=1131652 RepID=A0AAD4KZ95_9EURO|nr:uncharacterized protein BGW36DRAFT_369954 [Talaromyces proteolyticus]KAH8703762.1 hypothetical protein BGW36DRAFT_369954 [Talaromyces proteolyticus]